MSKKKQQHIFVFNFTFFGTKKNMFCFVFFRELSLSALLCRVPEAVSLIAQGFMFRFFSLLEKSYVFRMLN